MLKNLAKSHLYEGRALLVLGQHEGAIACLQRALTLADRIHHGSLRWRTRLRLGQAYAALGQPHAEVYRRAMELVQDIASDLQDERQKSIYISSPLARELTNAIKVAEGTETETSRPKLEAGGLGSPLPGPAVLAGLTPREIEVLRLVAQGATDRGIAEALHISVRTVNAHVAHILNKTGCANRAAAAAFAAQHDLA